MLMVLTIVITPSLSQTTSARTVRCAYVAELVEPSFGVCDTVGAQRKPSMAAVDAYGDQSGVAQDLEVAGDGRSADLERLG